MKTEIVIAGLGCLLLGLVAMATIRPAFGQTAYPSKPVRLIVPYPPGGTTDILARVIGQKLSTAWGQQVIVDNRGGANGNIGSDIAAKSPPDGYTLLMGSVGPLTINPSVYSKMPFDTVKHFAPVTMIAEVPLVLVAHPSVPVMSMQELIAFAKSKPGQLTFASAGNGSTQHLAGELLKFQTGIEIRHIPYKGAGPALVDLLAGQVTLMIDLIPSSLPHISGGKLRALAVTTAKRSSAIPNLPTFDESGLRNFDVSSWFGILTPAGTPKAIISRLNADIVSLLKTEEVKQSLASQGAEVVGNSPDMFADQIRHELVKWAKAVKAANVRID